MHSYLTIQQNYSYGAGLLRRLQFGLQYAPFTQLFSLHLNEFHRHFTVAQWSGQRYAAKVLLAGNTQNTIRIVLFSAAKLVGAGGKWRYGNIVQGISSRALYFYDLAVVAVAAEEQNSVDPLLF